MTIRAGMVDLVTELRGMTAAETDEFTLNGETYWSPDHLQDVLDRNRQDIYRELLTVQTRYTDSNVALYQDYYFAAGHVENALSGTFCWRLENSAGSMVSTADYIINYQARHIRFNQTTGGSAYYLNYRAYNLEMAAADVYDRKASSVASRFDVSTDNHSLKRSQLYDMYTKEATKWRARALSSQANNAGESYLVRDDVNVVDTGTQTVIHRPTY